MRKKVEYHILKNSTTFLNRILIPKLWQENRQYARRARKESQTQSAQQDLIALNAAKQKL